MQMFNFKHVNSTINSDGTIHIPKLRTYLSALLITVKEGERTSMTSIYVIASLFFVYRLLYGIHHHNIGVCQEY